MVEFSGKELSSFRGGRLVLRDLSFSVRGGEALLLTGPNGSGKSTLLRLMAGLLDPLTGTLFRDGVDVTEDAEAHRHSTYYFGHAEAIKPALTIREDLQFWRGLNQADTDLEEAISALGLSEQADLPGRYLSAGQRRRTALARLMVKGADLWLLDEPSVGLDKASTKLLSDLVKRHQDSGGMVVAATHVDLNLANETVLDIGQFAVDPGEALSFSGV